MAKQLRRTEYQKKWGKRQVTILLTVDEFKRLEAHAASEKRKIANMAAAMVVERLDSRPVPQ